MIKDIFKNKYEIILRDNYMHIKYYSSIIDINYNLIRIGLDSNILIINGNSLVICAMDKYDIVIKGNTN